VAARDVPLNGELRRRSFRARSDGEHLGIGDGAQTLYELLRDSARPEYPPPELTHDVCPSLLCLTRPDPQAAMLHTLQRGIKPRKLRQRCRGMLEEATTTSKE